MQESKQEELALPELWAWEARVCKPGGLVVRPMMA
jgi:hypothetical protein